MCIINLIFAGFLTCGNFGQIQIGQGGILQKEEKRK
jgi:hypothetical protein